MLKLCKPSEPSERAYAKRAFGMKYSPRILKQKVLNRSKSALLYIKSGKYRYNFENGEFTAESNSLVYLPQSASYTYEVLSEKTLCMQIDFSLFLICNGKEEAAVFCDDPMLIDDKVTSELEELFTQVINGERIISHSAYFSSDAAFYTIISRLCALMCKDFERASPAVLRIKRAVEYIDENYNEEIEVSFLASLCDISESQLRRLFNDAFGVSPIKYKNRLRMKNACLMLKSGTMNISEIADAMNFDSIYLFSQAFKKELGVSPKKYISDNYARFT